MNLRYNTQNVHVPTPTLMKNQGSGKMHRVVLVVAARRKGVAADTNSRSKTVGVAVAEQRQTGRGGSREEHEREQSQLYI